MTPAACRALLACAALVLIAACMVALIGGVR